MNIRLLINKFLSPSQILAKAKLFILIKNWNVLLSDYFNFTPGGDFEIIFRKKGTLKLRLGTTDKWSVHEIILRDDYMVSNGSKTKMNIIDLGANTGVFTVFAAMSNPKSRIFSYEPEVINFSYLHDNILMNKLENVHAFKQACSGRNGTQRIFLDEDGRSHSLVKKNLSQFGMISTITLEKIIQTHRIKKCDLLKMDIEGSEYEVLYKLPDKTLEKVCKISMEYHNMVGENNNGVALRKYLISKGFKVKIKDLLDGEVGMLYAERIRSYA